MTDPVQSGGDAPAAEPNPAVSPGGTTQPFGTFSTTRGSGLARGKRSTVPAAASAAPAATGDYKPTALEVITPEREYKNPFGDQSAGLPVNPPAKALATEGASAKEEVRAKYVVPVKVDEPVSRPTPAFPAGITEAPSADLFPLTPEKTDVVAPPAAKAALNILPQAETKRPALNWESAPPSASKASTPDYPPRPPREERPTFRPEPRRDQPRPEGRADFRPEGRNSRPAEAREPHREREPRRDVSAPAPQKPQGFFAWLKGLFAGKPASEPAPEFRREDRGFQGGDGQHRRRRRGGRGRQFSDRGGDRQGQPQNPAGGDGRFQGGERHGDEHGGNRPRRHRGGRGRGDRGGGPRPEGHQGGGAI